MVPLGQSWKRRPWLPYVVMWLWEKDRWGNTLTFHACSWYGAECSDSAMQDAMRPLPNENEINMAFVWILLCYYRFGFQIWILHGLPMINPVTTPYHIVAFKTYDNYIALCVTHSNRKQRGVCTTEQERESHGHSFMKPLFLFAYTS